MATFLNDVSLKVESISVEKELEKNTGITREDISRLREWLDSQPHLPKDSITDLDLILVYHASGCSSQVAKQLLDLHFTLRTHLTLLFHNRIVDNDAEPLLNIMSMTPLPGRTKEGYPIFFGRTLDLEVKNMEYATILRHILMIIDLWQYEEGTWPGFVFVFDLQGMSLGHLARIDIKVLQQFMCYLQEAILLKMTSIHLLNAPPFMDKLTALFKLFIKTELLDVLNVHEGMGNLEEYVPIELLPDEMGGKAGTLQECKDRIVTKLLANKEYFVEENKKRVTEALRPGKPKSISDIFGGTEGSFKQLQID